MLKELEGAVLGFVYRSGPCTAYQVRQFLRDSPSSHWQGSAGSIYPLLERLERDGLIAGADDQTDGRARRELSVTSNGKSALKEWIKAGSQEDLIAQVSDPVRTRMFFWDVLTPREQKALAEEMLRELEAFLALSEDRLKCIKGAPLSVRLGAKGAVLTNRARVQFMKEVIAAQLGA